MARWMRTDANQDSANSGIEVVETLAELGAETPTERQVKRIVPWVVSIFIHVGLVLLALFITWTVANIPEDDQSVLIVAEFNALNYDPVSPVASDTGPKSKQSETSNEANKSIKDRLSEKMKQTQSDPLMMFAELPKLDTDAWSMFTTPKLPDAATFAGLSDSNARTIVYVIDASGSMVPYLQVAIDELERSLRNLEPPQQFSVIFFQEDEIHEVPASRKLVLATETEKIRAMKWINRNVIPSGGTDPLTALNRALSRKPDVIFLLSQNITGYGKFEVDQEELLAWLDENNPTHPNSGRRRTRINCIQFLDRDPLETMVKIAEAHGGADGYKFLSRMELGLASP